MQESQGASDARPCEAVALARRYFNYAHLRAGQKDAIEAACAGRDVLVVLPTGAGKSLCYQVPALWHRRQGRGPTLVVSPLIALMDDQVQALQTRGVHAAALHSQQPAAGRRRIFAALRSRDLDLLYVSPERALAPDFLQALADFDIAALAVDEAHCISVWGHDFRPEYQRLLRLRQVLAVPVMALTATATGRTRAAIVASLGLRDPLCVSGSVQRANLHFAAMREPSAKARSAHVARALEAAGLGRDIARGRAIVYCATRARADKVASELADHALKVAVYHAGHTEAHRKQAQQAFIAGTAPVVVATSAFGMGIDQADVRMVVHMQAPASVEAYYQEAGRAGRDGASARCLLLWGDADWMVQRRLQSSRAPAALVRAREQQLEAMQRYAGLRSCRQRYMIDYFTEAVPGGGGVSGDFAGACGTCDGCLRPAAAAGRAVAEAVVPEVPPQALEQIVAAVAALRRPAGKVALAQALRGSRSKPARAVGLGEAQGAGALKAQPQTALVAAIEALIVQGRLERRGRKYPKVWLAGRAVRGAVAKSGQSAPPRRASKRAKAAGSPLRRALENYVRRTARQLGWRKPYMVLTRDVMRQIETARPGTLDALAALKGIGPAKIERFGVDVLALIRDHL